MRMEIMEHSRRVELWLTREEGDDPALREALRPMYRHCQERGYLVAVFLSGEEELLQHSRELLRYNRRRLAEREALRAGPAAER